MSGKQYPTSAVPPLPCPELRSSPSSRTPCFRRGYVPASDSCKAQGHAFAGHYIMASGHDARHRVPPQLVHSVGAARALLSVSYPLRPPTASVALGGSLSPSPPRGSGRGRGPRNPPPLAKDWVRWGLFLVYPTRRAAYRPALFFFIFRHEIYFTPLASGVLASKAIFCCGICLGDFL